MSVYLDELFMINFIACLSMLLVYRRLMSLPKSMLRLITASAIGAAAACVRFLGGTSLFAVTELLVPMCAFRKISPGKIILFVLVKYGFSGSAVLAVSLFGGSAAIIRGGILYFDISPSVFAAIFVLTYISGILLVRLVKKTKSRRFYTLVVYREERSVRLSALYDSGNLLMDPYDGSEVVIAERAAVEDIWDGSFVLIPYRTVGTENGMIKAFKADRAEVVETGRILTAPTIGISETELSKNRKIQALIGKMEE